MNTTAITIEDLHVGDEIVVSRFSGLVYLKVLHPPSKNKDGYWKSVKCSVHVDEIKHQNIYGEWTTKIYRCSPLDHNCTRYYNLTGRTLWLVKREN